MTHDPFIAFTDADLEAELERRKEVAKQASRPRPLKNPDLTRLISTCERYISGLYEDRRSPKDAAHYIFEDTLRAIYGHDIFVWVNEQLD